MRTLPAESRLLLAVATLSLAGAVVSAVVISRDFEVGVEAVGGQVLASAAEAFSLQQQAEVEKLSSTLDALMTSAELRQTFLGGDRARLLALTAPILETLRERSRITHWYFYTAEPKPSVFLRVHRPELHGDRPERATIRQALRTGEQGAGLELGKTAYALRVVRPWYVGGRLVGYLELAEEVDHLLGAMKGRSGDEYTLLVRRELLDPAAWAAVVGPRVSRWDSSAEVLVVNSTGGGQAEPEWHGDVQALPERGLWLGEVERVGRAFIRGVFPLSDADGRRVGALVVVHDFTGPHQTAKDGRAFALAVLLALALLGTAGLAALLRFLVFRRLARLRARLEARAATITPAGQATSLNSPDDLGRLEVLFERALGDAAANRPRDR